MKKCLTTLLYLVENDNVLLALKKRGFGNGRYNGVGGKVENGETIEHAMIRETQEEIGVTPLVYKKVAILTFDEYVKGERQIVEVHTFIATQFSGEPTESDEVSPKWFNINEIPFSQMFPDDEFFLREILSGKKINGFFEYDENFNMLSHNVEIVEDI